MIMVCPFPGRPVSHGKRRRGRKRAAPLFVLARGGIPHRALWGMT